MAVGVPNPFTAQSCASGLIRSRCGHVFHSATSTGGGDGVRNPIACRTYLLMRGSATHGYHRIMATQKQRQAARKNVKKAQKGARQKKTITKLSSKTRSALGREGAKAAARKRGASTGTGSGAGAGA